MPRITEDAVVATADALLERGANPTNARVRAALGRGSSTTINRHMRTWRARQAEADPQALPDIPETVRQPFVDLWTIACTEARRLAREELAGLRREAEARRDSALEAADQEKRGREKIEYECKLLKERLADKDKARLEAVDEVGRLRQALNSVNADFSRHQMDSRAAIDKAQAEADKARQVQQTSAEHARAHRQAMQRLLDKADSRYENDREAFRRQLETAEQAAAKAKTGEAEVGARLAEASARAVQSEREIARLNERLAEQKKRAGQQRADYQAALEQASELKGKLGLLREQKANSDGKRAKKE